ncbi:MAG: hypothetical protein ACI4J1_08965 [Ruminiclostridium sp.]
MKKRILAAVIFAAMALGVCGCGNNAAQTTAATTTANTEATVETSATEETAVTDEAEGNTTIANPIVDCGGDLDKAAELAGFEMKIPELSNYTVSVIDSKIIEVTFPKDDETDIFFRMSIENIPNLSGIYLSADGDPVTETLDSGISVEVQKENDLYYSATVTAENGNYCVGCTAGLSKEEMFSYAESFIEANKPSGMPDDSVLGTVVDCGTDLAKAAEITGCKMEIPELSNYEVNVLNGTTISVSITIDPEEDIYVNMRLDGENMENVIRTGLDIAPVTEDWNGIEVTACKEGDTYYALGFGAEIGYYGVTCPKGMDKDSLYSYLESLYNANKNVYTLPEEIDE